MLSLLLCPHGPRGGQANLIWWHHKPLGRCLNAGLSIPNQAWNFLPVPELTPGSKARCQHIPSTSKAHLASSHGHRREPSNRQTPLGDLWQCSNRFAAIKVSSYHCNGFHKHWVLSLDFNYSHFMGFT